MFEEKDVGSRLIWVQWVVAISFLILTLRLWQLQVIRGSDYLARSIKNRTRVQRIQAPRGFILDAKGRFLAKNIPSFNVCLIPQYFRGDLAGQGRLAKILALNPPLLMKKIGALKSLSLFAPIKIKEGIGRDELGFIAQDKTELPGVTIDTIPKRVYPETALAAHLLGYVGEADKDDLRQGQPVARNYQLGDCLGKSGVERAMDGFLRGVDGYTESEVDASGQRTRVLTEREAMPGGSVFLSVDLDLQRLGEECLSDHRGALVALDPRDGKVLAMVSRPSFDPGFFSQRITKRGWRGLLTDPSSPLMNRAIHGQFPPGSIYKVISAIGGLEEGVIDPDTTFYCPGYLKLGNRYFSCWKQGGHGRVNLRQAIVSSCDVYFYQVGLRLGVDGLKKYAQLFGLGAKTGINLQGEKAGLIPSYRWKKERVGGGWSAGEVACLAIGQGYNLITPLQAANLYAAIGNGGTLYLPKYILKGVKGDGTVDMEFSPQPTRRVSVSPDTLAIVRDALGGAVNAPEGTGGRGRVVGIEVAGKTGTAQVVGRGKGSGKRFSDHAWFVAFAPKDEPEIVVAVVIEHGGHGGAAAAPVAQKFLTGWRDCARRNIRPH